MALDFLDGVTKSLKKAGIEVGASAPPSYWFSSGNYVLNKIMSGSFLKGIPQGRITCFTGPSGSGKSFLAANAMREAQLAGAHIVTIDSENALDDDFATSVGVNVEEGYTYIPVDTIPQTKKVVSAFITAYKSEYEGNDDAPKVLIVIDSLDMLMTETEVDHFNKGESKGDQGQRNKQLKAMLREFVQAIKRTNISMIVTAQVYRNQDITNGEGLWMVSDAIRFSLSQIVLLQKLKLRDGAKVSGIRMKVEGYKTRFTQPFQTAVIEVPYETGMDPYNGLLDVAKDMGIVTTKGAWSYFGEDKFQSGTFSQYAQDILIKCEANRKQYLESAVSEEEVELTPQLTAVKRRLQKFQEQSVEE